MKKMNKFLEYFWLVASVLSLILVIYVYSTIGTEGNWILIFFPVIAIGMYVFRKRMSKKFEKNDR
jgi:c-di-AMP phosphodiesterase-like protein